MATNKKFIIILGVVVLCLLAGSYWLFTPKTADIAVEKETAPKAPEGKVHYLGVLPLKNPSTMVERFSGVEKYLREQTGLNIILRLYPTSGAVGGYSAVVRDIVNGSISFAFLAPVTGAQAYGISEGVVVPFACAQKSGSRYIMGILP